MPRLHEPDEGGRETSVSCLPVEGGCEQFQSKVLPQLQGAAGDAANSFAGMARVENDDESVELADPAGRREAGADIESGVVVGRVGVSVEW